MKYVSDQYAGQKNALLDVPKGGRFADMVVLKGDKEIGDKMNKIISKLADPILTSHAALHFPRRVASDCADRTR